MSHPQISNINGFHIELTNICTLKCAGCARTKFINQWPQNWKNFNVDADSLFKFLDIELLDKKIVLGGNYGDSIYHPELIDIVKKFKSRGAHISLVTNGSYKTAAWWEELCSKLDEQDEVCFSIDGVPENFTQYRKNGDWPSIKIGIDVCVKSRARTVWKYIPFSFNQDTIEQARDLSTQLGIDQFEVRLSDRFDSSTEYLKPTDQLLGTRYQQQEQFRNNALTLGVEPQCNDQQSHYISADGFYMPCCYIGNHQFYYKTQFGKNKKNYNIKNYSLSQLLKNSAVIQFYRSIEDQPVCQFNCPSKL